MNNQVKLIDSEKVKVWFLNMFDDWNPGSTPSIFYQQLENGDFDPDTPPVPTIKPGELVSIKSKPEYGTFVVEGLRAQIIPTATNMVVSRKVIVDLGDLEVVE
jgi:hypothetical protein